MKLVFLKFSKNAAPKIAALLSQYQSAKTLISITSDDLFTTMVTLCVALSEEDAQLMSETELSNYFKREL